MVGNVRHDLAKRVLQGCLDRLGVECRTDRPHAYRNCPKGSGKSRCSCPLLGPFGQVAPAVDGAQRSLRHTRTECVAKQVETKAARQAGKCSTVPELIQCCRTRPVRLAAVRLVVSASETPSLPASRLTCFVFVACGELEKDASGRGVQFLTVSVGKAASAPMPALCSEWTVAAYWF